MSSVLINIFLYLTFKQEPDQKNRLKPGIFCQSHTATAPHDCCSDLEKSTETAAAPAPKRVGAAEMTQSRAGTAGGCARGRMVTPATRPTPQPGPGTARSPAGPRTESGPLQLKSLKSCSAFKKKKKVWLWSNVKNSSGLVSWGERGQWPPHPTPAGSVPLHARRERLGRQSFSSDISSAQETQPGQPRRV